MEGVEQGHLTARSRFNRRSAYQPARHSGRNDSVHDPVDPARDVSIDAGGSTVTWIP